MKAKHKHLAHGIGMTEARELALRDISEDVKKDKTRNYARIESIVLSSLRRNQLEIIPLNV